MCFPVFCLSALKNNKGFKSGMRRYLVPLCCIQSVKEVYKYTLIVYKKTSSKILPSYSGVNFYSLQWGFSGLMLVYVRLDFGTKPACTFCVWQGPELCKRDFFYAHWEWAQPE